MDSLCSWKAHLSLTDIIVCKIVNCYQCIWSKKTLHYAPSCSCSSHWRSDDEGESPQRIYIADHAHGQTEHISINLCKCVKKNICHIFKIHMNLHSAMYLQEGIWGKSHSKGEEQNKYPETANWFEYVENKFLWICLVDLILAKSPIVSNWLLFVDFCSDVQT